MNRLITVSALISCATLAGVGLVQTARADEWDKKTNITIDQPIAVQHTVLTPGKYVFKLLDSQSDRHIVQIFNEDQSHIITTILAVPNYRLQPTGHSMFAFWETPAGQPPAMRAWFYPGDNFGQEFLNSKPAATQVASATTTEVPVTYSKATEEPKPPTEIAQAAPPPEPEPAPAPAPAVTESTPEPTPAPAPEPEPQSAPLVAQNDQPVTLPQTASYYPFLALAGLLSLGLFAFMSLSAARRTQ